MEQGYNHYWQHKKKNLLMNIRKNELAQEN
jgi:hypothetical protein